MLDAILFPSDYFDKNQVDDDLKREYDAVIECGLFSDVYLFSYEKWFHEGKLSLNKVPEHKILAAYRGWMMQPEQYAQFYSLLAQKNIELITTPEEYERFHIFPNVYEKFGTDTPGMIVFPKGSQIDLETVKESFSRFMVKDYVKSVKGTDFPIFFDRSVDQAEFDAWMEKFYQYRGSLFTGGICIKEYVDLKLYGTRKNEYRVFYIHGEIATVNRNSGQAEYAPRVPEDLVKKYCGMNSTFYTVDFAEKADGDWIVIEAGDGSVSGLSDFQNYVEFFRELYYCFA